MRHFPRLTNISALMLLLAAAFYVFGLRLTPVQAQTELLSIGERCTIPDSGPWPPCATGGSATPSTDCVIPESGPWPPCASGGGSAPAPGTSSDCIIPASGPWPPCATNGSAPAAPSDTSECVVPTTGPWPPCATGGVPPTIPAPAPEPQPEPEPAPQSGNYAITDVEILETGPYDIKGRFYQENMPEGYIPAFIIVDLDNCFDFCASDENELGQYRISGWVRPENAPTTGWIEFPIDIDQLICPYQPHSMRFFIGVRDRRNEDIYNLSYSIIYEFEFDHKWCE